MAQLDEIEARILAIMGYRFDRIRETNYPVYRNGYEQVPMGWLYTPEGAHEAKEYFARHRNLVVLSYTLQNGRGYAEAYCYDSSSDEAPVPLAVAFDEDDEPTAVIFAINKALDVLERTPR